MSVTSREKNVLKMGCKRRKKGKANERRKKGRERQYMNSAYKQAILLRRDLCETATCGISYLALIARNTSRESVKCYLTDTDTGK